MSELETIEQEVQSQEIVVRAAEAQALMATQSPAEFIEKATEVANALSDVVEKKGLAVSIQGRKHVLYEGWTALGALIGAFTGGQSIFPVVEWTRPVYDEQGAKIGWEARVNAQTMDGRVIASAESQCLRQERQWASRDDYALRSMAQTRAGSKAMRQPLGFIMVLAGYDALPKEELPSGDESPAAVVEQPKRKKALKKTIEAIKKAADPLPASTWSDEAILRSATRSFGRKIDTFEDLFEDEAKMILDAARAAG